MKWHLEVKQTIRVSCCLLRVPRRALSNLEMAALSISLLTSPAKDHPHVPQNAAVSVETAGIAPKQLANSLITGTATSIPSASRPVSVARWSEISIDALRCSTDEGTSALQGLARFHALACQQCAFAFTLSPVVFGPVTRVAPILWHGRVLMSRNLFFGHVER